MELKEVGRVYKTLEGGTLFGMRVLEMRTKQTNKTNKRLNLPIQVQLYLEGGTLFGMRVL